MKIFIVDDSSMQRDRVKETVQQIPDAVIVGEADSAVEAIEGIRRAAPDVVILDVRLRAGTGLDVLHEIKKSGFPVVTVIVMTNYPYEQYRRLSMSMGADYFFHKATQFSSAMNVLRGIRVMEDLSNPN